MLDTSPSRSFSASRRSSACRSRGRVSASDSMPPIATERPRRPRRVDHPAPGTGPPSASRSERCIAALNLPISATWRSVAQRLAARIARGPTGRARRRPAGPTPARSIVNPSGRARSGCTGPARCRPRARCRRRRASVQAAPAVRRALRRERPARAARIDPSFARSHRRGRTRRSPAAYRPMRQATSRPGHAVRAGSSEATSSPRPIARLEISDCRSSSDGSCRRNGGRVLRRCNQASGRRRNT